ncbi:MAG: tail fiber domain-containing protein, partial [Pseudomonadota bacterium]
NAQAIAAQSSLAAGHKGYSTAALRAAGRNTARLQQENNAQTGILAAQEAAQARGELAGVIQSTRATDVDVAKTNAGYSQETGLTYAGAQNRMKELQAQITQSGGQFNAAQQNELTKLQAQLDSGNAQFNAGEVNKGAALDTESQLRTNLANLDAELKNRGMNDEQRRAYLQAYLTNQGQVLQADSNYADRVAKKEINPNQIIQGTISGGASIGAAAATSDRRAKTDIEEVSPKDAADFKKSLASMYSYRYKDPGASGSAPGDHFGPMAQDLEKSKIGRSLVITGPDGMKRIDTDRLVLALASTVAASSRKKGR